MVSKLEIFKTNIEPSKNMKIDLIDEYLLDKCERTYVSDAYQYQKITLDKSFKVTANQEDFNGLSMGNYIRLTQDGRIYYYFIMSNEWTSINSCRLECSIDSINTFSDDLEWTDKTNIIREHSDRYTQESGVVTKQEKFTVSGTSNDVVFTLQSDELKNATIVGTPSSETIVSLGTILATNVKQTSFDSTSGTIVLSVTFITQSSKASGIIKFDISYKGVIRRLIDTSPEGLSPQLFGEDKGEILNKGDGSNWYIIYNTNVTAESPVGASVPVDTLLCKDEPITAMVSTGYSNTAVITPSDIETGHYYFIDPFNGTGVKYKDKYQSYHYWKGTKSSQTISDGLNQLILKTEAKDLVLSDDSRATSITCLVFYLSGGGIQCDKVVFDGYTDVLEAPDGKTIVTPLLLTEKISIRSDQVFKIFDSTTKATSKNDSDLYDIYKTSPIKPITGDDKEPVRIGGISEVDVTRSTLIKVIKMPYCPVDYIVDKEGRYIFNYNLVRNPKETNKLNTDLIQVPTTVKFKSTIKSNIDNPIYKIVENVKITPSKYDLKNDKYETKLYNSEFYQPKFIYDSFGFTFDLEKVKPSIDTVTPYMNIEFIPTRVFNSTMMYRFNDYQTDGKDLEDFNNILIVNRNNEMPIYNSEYLNYIRTGYNYDKKAKDRAFNWELGTAIAGVAVLGAMAAVPGVNTLYHRHIKQDVASHIDLWNGGRTYDSSTVSGVPLTSSLVASGGIQGAVSSAFNIANVIRQKKESEIALEQKKKVLAEQATSVGNADSIDLLDAYSNNKAKLKLYKPTPKTTELLFDLFYYNGYSRNIKRIPDTQSRYWFNYLQCEPVFKTNVSSVYNNFIDDIKARYNAGVTIYHHHKNTLNEDEWDIEQKYENWETNLLP